MRDWRAEYGHHAVADMLVDVPAVLLDGAISLVEVAIEHGEYFLRVDFTAHLRKATQVGEEDGDLPSFAFRVARARGAVPGFFGVRPQFRQCSEQFAAMTHRSNTQFFQIVRGEIAKHVGVDGVVAKHRFIPLHSEVVQPRGDVHEPS
ncbi:hypothetical protein OKW31_007395 [Paraburkholderia atlantica]